jgi:hypothetical protein
MLWMLMISTMLIVMLTIIVVAILIVMLSRSMCYTSSNR